MYIQMSTALLLQLVQAAADLPPTDVGANGAATWLSTLVAQLWLPVLCPFHSPMSDLGCFFETLLNLYPLSHVP